MSSLLGFQVADRAPQDDNLIIGQQTSQFSRVLNVPGNYEKTTVKPMLIFSLLYPIRRLDVFAPQRNGRDGSIREFSA